MAEWLRPLISSTQSFNRLVAASLSLDSTRVRQAKFCLLCLFGLRLYIPVNNFSVMWGCFPGLNQYIAIKMKCLARGHNTLVRFEPTTF